MLASIINFLRLRKDVLTFLVAVPLSYVFAVIALSSGLGFGTAFVIFSFLLAFIVCFISDSKTILFAVISNLIFIICFLIHKYVVLAQPFYGWTSETSKILFVLFVISFFLALAISVPFTLIRKEIREN